MVLFLPTVLLGNRHLHFDSLSPSRYMVNLAGVLVYRAVIYNVSSPAVRVAGLHTAVTRYFFLQLFVAVYCHEASILQDYWNWLVMNV